MRIPLLPFAGMLIIAAYILVAIFAPLIAPYGQTIVVGPSFDLPSAAHWLGTDGLGRDMLSRLIYGARNMLALAIAINLLSFLAGASLGMLSALAGGWVDQILGRFMDAAMAIPQLILALLLIAILGNSLILLILIIAFLDAPRVYRLARAAAMNVAAMDYVEAARLRGEGMAWCILHEILPNIRVPLLAEFGIRFCYVFLFISGLGFLGVGLQPPAADWGSMVRDSATLITYGVFTPLYPALAIAGLTISVNFVVDWIVHRNHKEAA